MAAIWKTYRSKAFQPWQKKVDLAHTHPSALTSIVTTRQIAAYCWPCSLFLSETVGHIKPGQSEVKRCRLCDGNSLDSLMGCMSAQEQMSWLWHTCRHNFSLNTSHGGRARPRCFRHGFSAPPTCQAAHWNAARVEATQRWGPEQEEHPVSAGGFLAAPSLARNQAVAGGSCF